MIELNKFSHAKIMHEEGKVHHYFTRAQQVATIASCSLRAVLILHKKIFQGKKN